MVAAADQADQADQAADQAEVMVAVLCLFEGAF
jgi:hypothetical protein